MDHKTILLLLSFFWSTILTSPVPEPSYSNSQNSLNTIENIQENVQKDLDAENEFTTEGTTTKINTSDDDDLETADMIIFRPLFVYRQKTEQKYRLQNVNRRYYRRY